MQKKKSEKSKPIQVLSKKSLVKNKHFWPSLLLIASGTAALIFQVLWIKQLTLIVGVDVYAVTTGISAFFAGLALGGIFIGKIADKVKRPLVLYSVLELGVALIGIIMTFLLPRTASLFAQLETESSVLAWSLIFLMVAIGPFLMGGTLPAIVRSLELDKSHLGSGGGKMYAANTMGAIVGALLSSFYLIPSFGIQGTAKVAACIGILAAIGAFWLNKNAISVEIKKQPDTIPKVKTALIAIVFYSIAGGLALGYEVIWSQSIVQFMSTRSFAFSVMLATYLSGLALGSALITRKVDRVKNPWSLFGFLIAAAGFIALIEISLLGPWLFKLQSITDQTVLSFTESRLAGMSSRFAIAALYIVFIPTLFLGAAFPVALKLIVDSRHVGRDIGKVVALNTLGGITGSIITGFLLIPQFGLVKSLAILAVAAAILGFLASIRGDKKYNTLKYVTSLLLIATLFAAFLTPKDRLANLLAESKGGEMIFYKEGHGGTVAVLEQMAGKKPFRRLYIQGVSNTGDAMPSLRYMRLQALLPLIIHNGEPKSALVIGLGTGITSGSLLKFPGLKKRVVAELLPEVLQSSVYFKGNYDVTSNSEMDIRLRDGRRELLSNTELYDLITLEPPPPSAAGVVNLYSTNFYELAKARLNPKGIVAQWLPIPTQNDEDTQSLVKSFLDVFPYASLWTTEIHEMLLIGSMEPIILDVPKIIERFNQPETLDALKDVGISSPEALIASWITDRKGLEKYAGNALPVTDDWPRIEYADWVRHDEIQRVLPKFIMLYNDPPLKNADEDFVKKVANERQILLLFYQATLNGSQGYKEEWARDMQNVLKMDGNNAYYNWFGGQN